MSCIEIQNELYKRKPFLKQHHQKQIESQKDVGEACRLGGDCSANRARLQTHHQINTNT